MNKKVNTWLDAVPCTADDNNASQICLFPTNPCSSLTNGLSHRNTQRDHRVFYLVSFVPCWKCCFIVNSSAPNYREQHHLNRARQERAKPATDAGSRRQRWLPVSRDRAVLILGRWSHAAACAAAEHGLNK